VNKFKQTLKYIVTDYATSMIVWVCFFAYRKIYVEPLKFGYHVPV